MEELRLHHTYAVLRRDRASARGDPLVDKGLDGTEHRRARLEDPWWRYTPCTMWGCGDVGMCMIGWGRAAGVRRFELRPRSTRARCAPGPLVLRAAVLSPGWPKPVSRAPRRPARAPAAASPRRDRRAHQGGWIHRTCRPHRSSRAHLVRVRVRVGFTVRVRVRVRVRAPVIPSRMAQSAAVWAESLATVPSATTPSPMVASRGCKGLLRGCQGAVRLQRVARAGLLLDDETHRGAVQELDGGQRLTWWGWKVGVRVAARRRPRSRLGGGLLTAYYY
eukprot:scaffold114066_cov57-Phaeocystis_antarctica.AAC.1